MAQKWSAYRYSAYEARKKFTYQRNSPMQARRQIWNNSILSQIRYDLCKVSFRECQGQRDLAGDLCTIGLVSLTLGTSCLIPLTKSCKCADVVRREGPKSDIVFLHRAEEDVDLDTAIQGMLLGFDVDEPLQVFVVWCKVSQERLPRFERLLDKNLRFRQFGVDASHFGDVCSDLCLIELLQKCSLWQQRGSSRFNSSLALANKVWKVGILLVDSLSQLHPGIA